MAQSSHESDRLLLSLVFLLLLFGLIVLTSASSAFAYTEFNDPYFFIKKQLLFGVVPGLVLFFLGIHLNYNIWKKVSWLLYGFSVILLILVFIPGIGLIVNGARSWISVAGYTFQPSELVKFSIIIILANLLSETNRDLGDWKNGLLPVLAIAAPSVLLVAAQPDIGTLFIIAVVIFAVLYMAGVKRGHLAILALLGIVAFAALTLLAPYRIKRLTTFLHPGLDPKGIGYQTNQAFLAIGSGGFWGLGFGHSRQKYQYLPEVQSDSIFAIVAEENGFLISAALIVLIAFITLRGLKIAQKAPDQFSRLLVGGIMVWFGWQSFLNIGSMVGIFPLTGVPLPFVSHGGSALLASMLAMGVVINVSRFSRR